MDCCIYLSIFKPTGQLYVGQHKGDLYRDGYAGSGSKVRELIKTHGRESFLVGVLEFCSHAMAGPLEDMYLSMFGAAKSDRFLNVLERSSGGGHTGYQCCLEEVDSPIIFHKKLAPHGMHWADVYEKHPWSLPKYAIRWVNRGGLKTHAWPWDRFCGHSFRGWSKNKDVAMMPIRKSRGLKYKFYHFLNCPAGIEAKQSFIRNEVGRGGASVVLSGGVSMGWSLCYWQSRDSLWRLVPKYWYHQSLSPNGALMCADDLSAKFGIHINKLHGVYFGKKSIAGGWAISPGVKKEDLVLGDLVTLKSPEGRGVTAYQRDFVKKYGLVRSKVSELCSGNRRTHKGWRLQVSCN